MVEKMHIVHQAVKLDYAYSAFARVRAKMHAVHMDISRFRRDRGLSQRDLAEMLGRDQSTIQRAEAMHHSAKLTTYREYAQALGLQLWQLFSEEITPDDLALLQMFRKIPPEKHDELLAILRIARGSGEAE